MSFKVAINGFGRIGRSAFKLAMEHPEIEVVGVFYGGFRYGDGARGGT